MWERDKVFKKYHNSSNEIMKLNYYNHYKLLRNQLTSKKGRVKFSIIRVTLIKINKNLLLFGKESDHW